MIGFKGASYNIPEIGMPERAAGDPSRLRLHRIGCWGYSLADQVGRLPPERRPLSTRHVRPDKGRPRGRPFFIGSASCTSWPSLQLPCPVMQARRCVVASARELGNIQLRRIAPFGGCPCQHQGGRTAEGSAPSCAGRRFPWQCRPVQQLSVAARGGRATQRRRDHLSPS